MKSSEKPLEMDQMSNNVDLGSSMNAGGSPEKTETMLMRKLTSIIVDSDDDLASAPRATEKDTNKSDDVKGSNEGASPKAGQDASSF